MINLAMLGTILAFLQDRISANWFSHLFQWLAVVSIIPSAIASILEPVVKLITTFKNCLFSCSGLYTVTNIGAAGEAAGQVTELIRGDDGVHDQALYALERDQETAEEEAAQGYDHPEHANGNEFHDWNSHQNHDENGMFDGYGHANRADAAAGVPEVVFRVANRNGAPVELTHAPTNGFYADGPPSSVRQRAQVAIGNGARFGIVCTPANGSLETQLSVRLPLTAVRSDIAFMNRRLGQGDSSEQNI
eukprot:3932754-Rhodomonas_salina.2